MIASPPGRVYYSGMTAPSRSEENSCLQIGKENTPMSSNWRMNNGNVKGEKRKIAG